MSSPSTLPSPILILRTTQRTHRTPSSPISPTASSPPSKPAFKLTQSAPTTSAINAETVEGNVESSDLLKKNQLHPISALLLPPISIPPFASRAYRVISGCFPHLGSK